MKAENWIILGLFAVGAVAVAAVHLSRGTTTGLGYYEMRPDGKKVPLHMDLAQARLKEIEELPISEEARQKARDRIRFSWPRTIGIWLAAFFTLAIFSFLYKDNPFYKIAEHAFVGISAAYWMTVAFWTTVVPNLFGKLFPRWTKMHFLPGLNLDEIVETLAAKSWLQKGEHFLYVLPGFIDYEGADGNGLTASTMQLMNVWYWIPLILGVMLLWRLAPRGAWIARWPLAFILGTTAGIRLTGYLESDFMKQIQSTIVPLYVPVYHPDTGAFEFGRTFYESLKNILLVVGVVCGLVYFFFSLEHRGIIGKASRVGIWVLMITFGAGFGYTVMGRIALLLGRFEFLVFDWLNIVPR